MDKVTEIISIASSLELGSNYYYFILTGRGIVCPEVKIQSFSTLAHADGRLGEVF